MGSGAIVSFYKRLAVSLIPVPSVNVPMKHHLVDNGALLSEIAKCPSGREAQHGAEMPANTPNHKEERAQGNRSAPEGRNGTRMPRFHQCYQRHFLPTGDQLLSHLEGYHSADTEARQPVRPLRLHLANLSNEMFGDGLDSLQRSPSTLDAGVLKHIHRLVGTEKSDKVGIPEHVTVRQGNN